MWQDGLYPEEQALVSKSVPKRVREFTAGRNCARVILDELGFPAQPILADDSRAPILPAGLTLSITHTTGFCAAAGARKDAIASIGIDAEDNKPLSTGVQTLVLTDQDHAAAAALEMRTGELNWPLVCFCLKEAFYKAHYQLHGRFVGFEELALSLDIAAYTAQPSYLSAPLRRDMRGFSVHLRFLETPQRVFATASIGASSG